MWRIAATLIVVAMLVLVNGSTAVNGQSTCIFAGGFATLRHLIGAQKVGDCIESEHFNPDNGNSEQATTGGLMVWRKADNVTAFTDGVTTWLNGPNGLESRPNGERLAWETEPSSSTRTVSTIPPPPSADTSQPTSAAAVASPDARSAAASPAAVAQAAVTPTVTPTPTPAATPTKTPNPLDVKLIDMPDNADTGSVLKFVARTSAKKGICTLLIKYRDTDQVNIGNAEIEDGKCEWKFILPSTTKTGTAKATVNVSTDVGATATSGEEDFRVRKGEETHAGNTEVSLQLEDAPDEVKVGESFKITVETDMSSRGKCDLNVTWPKGQGGTPGEQKSPSGDRCSWTLTVPPTLTKQGKAILTVTVSRGSVTRSVSKEFDLKVN